MWATASATCPAGGSRPSTLYSRSGVPYCAKSAHGVDPYGEYEPVVCTPEEFAELTHPGRLAGPATGGLPDRAAAPSLRRDAGPLLHPRRLPQGWSRGVGRRPGPSCAEGWVDGHCEKAVDALEPLYGRFDPASHVFAGAGRQLHVERRLPGATSTR